GTPDSGAPSWSRDRLGGRIPVFGVPLHYHLHYASRASGNYDMRRLLDDTLLQQRGRDIVSFVENHDSQPLQALESVVEPWFKPLAYALILLRHEGYPCVFYPDYYGAEYEDYGRDGSHEKAMAVLMSDGEEGTKWMEVGRTNTRFTDLTEHVKEPVVTNDAGWGEFRCNGGSGSVWVHDNKGPKTQGL